MLVRLEDIPILDVVKGLSALFLCLGIWWIFNLKRESISLRFFWIFLFFIQLSFGLGTYWYQSEKYSNSEGGDAAALFLNAGKLLNLNQKSSVDFWSLIATGSPKTKVGETTVMHMEIWSKRNHYGFGNEKQRLVRLTALLLWASGKNYFLVFSVFTFLSWLGLQGVALFFRGKCVSCGKKILGVAILLSPSTLIWTSLPGKESLLLFGIGSIMSSFSIMKSRTWLALFGTFIGVYVLFEFRIFLLLCGMPALLFMVISKIYSERPLWFSTLLSLSAPLLACLVLQFWAWKHQPSVLKSKYKTQEEYERDNGASYGRQVQQPGVNLLEKLKFKRLDLEVEAKQKKPRTYVSFELIDGSLSGLIVGSPYFLVRGMGGFEWFQLDRKYWIWGLERLCFGGCWFFLLWVFINKRPKDHLLGALLIWTLILALLMGILMPVLGNISRYMAVLHLPLIGYGLSYASVYLGVQKSKKQRD